jgi:hypothetical protein
VQRGADSLLRQGQKPSVAALREQLLDKYWKSLGLRLQGGPEALDRVPESLARLAEALWLRAVGEARERVAALGKGSRPDWEVYEALEAKVSELTAALAESTAHATHT